MSALPLAVDCGSPPSTRCTHEAARQVCPGGALGGLQLITYHSMTSAKPIGTITPKTVPAMRRVRSATVSPGGRRCPRARMP